eukprot:GDKI01027789.1.p1 GENE.GDKI01027789.1~~GDKI01027789.1.p1  ORF type:complete len:400 (+),score=70.04 GDKI01027789.1:116-1201(+)
MYIFLYFAVLFVVTFCFFGAEVCGDSEVLPYKIVDQMNFDQHIVGSRMAFVFFYAPWSGHDKVLLPKFETTARQLQGAIDFFRVTGPENQNLVERFGISGYPSLLLYKSCCVGGGVCSGGGGVWWRYDGERDVGSMSGVLGREYEALVTHTHNGVVGVEGCGVGEWKGKRVFKHVAERLPYTQLNTFNFDSFFDDKQIAFVWFYAPWSAHDKALLPHFEGAARTLTNKVHFARVTGPDEPLLVQRFSVWAYPSLYMYKRGMWYERGVWFELNRGYFNCTQEYLVEILTKEYDSLKQKTDTHNTHTNKWAQYEHADMYVCMSEHTKTIVLINLSTCTHTYTYTTKLDFAHCFAECEQHTLAT